MTNEFLLIDPDTDDDPIEELTTAIELWAEKRADYLSGAPSTGAESYGFSNTQVVAHSELIQLLTNAVDTRVIELLKERLGS